MTRLIQYFLAFLCITVLTACGGGGGSPGGTAGAALFTTAGTTLLISPGKTQTFTIGGGVPSYAVSTTSGAVSATVNGTSLAITGSLGGGTGSVVVTDHAGTQVTILVTVGTGVTLFTTAPSSTTNPVIVAAGAARYPIYNIGGGTGVYSVASSNQTVAAAGLLSANSFAIIGVNPGSAIVSVTDTLGAVVTINVTVIASNVAPALASTAPTAINLPVTQTVSYNVSGGTPPYSIISDSIGIATVTPSSTTGAFSITGIAGGLANVFITDSVGAQLKTAVSVTAPSVSPLSVLPNGATGNVGDILQFNVKGGVAPYTVSNSNNTIATVTAAPGGATFTVQLSNIGSSVVTVIDAQGNSQNITVTVALNPPTLRLSPNAFEISEQSNNAISLYIYGGTGPYFGFTSDPKMGVVTLTNTSSNTGILTVGAVAAGARCFTPTTPLGTYQVTLTIIDSLGASATSIMSIRDTLNCP